MRKLFLLIVIMLVGRSAFAMPPIGAFNLKVPRCMTSFFDGTQTIPVGQDCFQAQVGSCPALTNAHDPINFSADNTGATPSDAAINSALGAGTDLVFGTAGTYLVNLASPSGTVTAHGIVPAANVKIECTAQNADGTPAVHLKLNTTQPQDYGLLALENGGNTVCGCDFVGAQSGSAPYNIVTQGGYLILVSSHSGYVIEGNTFEKGLGNAAIQANEDYTGSPSTGLTVQYNTFQQNPYYGFVSPIASNLLIQNNLAHDGLFGSECNIAGNEGSNNVFKHNMTDAVVGNCRAVGGTGCSQYSGYSIGYEDSVGSCNYSGWTVQDNQCTGTTSFPGLINNVQSSGGVATVNGNHLSNCTCFNSTTPPCGS